MADYQTHRASWQGIPLSVSYCAEPWASFRAVYGYAIAHVTVTAPCPLPISDSGFQSAWLPPGDIDTEGGPVPFVLAWLDAEATTPDWQRRELQARQLSLF